MRLFDLPNIKRMAKQRDVVGLIDALANPHAGIRRLAAEALGELDDVRAVEQLVVALGDEDLWVRGRAAETLGKLGDARAVEPLVAALDDEEIFVRETAAEALGKLGDARAAGPLFAALIGGRGDGRVIEALSTLGDPAVELVIAALRAVDVVARRWAAQALRELGDARAVVPLVAALGDEDGSVRSSAAQALGKLGDARAVVPLIAALRDEDTWVRTRAAEALGELGDVRAVGPLAAAGLDAFPAAREALEKLRGAAVGFATGPQCTRCRRSLKVLHMSRGAIQLGGTVPTLYDGVICTSCRRVECSACKGTPVDAPCSWCGSVVSPAYEHLL